MTEDEFKKVVKFLKASYPKEKFLETQEQAEVWFAMLKDLPFEPVSLGITQWITKNPWTPAISDIREMCVNVVMGSESSWENGWDNVMKSISRYGSYREDEALESMDEITRKATATIGFQNICMTESKDLSIIRAQFRDIYNTLAQSKHDNALLPNSVRNAIEQTRLKQLEANNG